MTRALITGGAGFLGRNIAEAMAAAAIEVVVYDKTAPEGVGDRISYVPGDIADLEALAAAAEGCNWLVHTAAIANIDETRRAPIATVQANVVGTAVCLEAARRADVGRFLYASSVYVAGKLGSFYRVSKLAGEQLCETYYREFGLPYTNLRYGSLYGRNANDWNFIYRFCREVYETGRFEYYGSGDEVREFINVEDAARETVNVAQQDDYACRTVLITGHQSMYMREFFELVSEIMDHRIDIKYLKEDNHGHYKRTPYTFDSDLPVRINMKHYTDISEGILGCLAEIKRELNGPETDR